MGDADRGWMTMAGGEIEVFLTMARGGGTEQFPASAVLLLLATEGTTSAVTDLTAGIWSCDNAEISLFWQEVATDTSSCLTGA